jgi:alkaline phosphatase
LNPLRFLAVADLHYTEKPVTGSRRHALSLEKLKNAIARDSAGCHFLANLGDTSDVAPEYLSQEEGLSRVTEVFASSGLPFFSVIGNHDTAVRKCRVTEICRMPGRYYSIDIGGFRCVFLDGSLNDPDDPEAPGLIEWANCWIDTKQVTWLQNELTASTLPVLIFCHPCFLLKEGWVEELHLIRNRSTLMNMFAESGKVSAVFCGHYHEGDFQYRDGIPYFTLAAMCEGERNTYAVVTVGDNRILVEGRGNQASFDVSL